MKHRMKHLRARRERVTVPAALPPVAQMKKRTPAPGPRHVKTSSTPPSPAGEPAPGHPQLRRISTRRELLVAGRRLFGSQGIYDSRIEDITERAGIAKGTLYLHFRSKEDLLGAVTRDGLLQLQSFVDASLGESRKLASVLAGILRAHLLFFQENPDLMRILHQVRGALKFDRPAFRPLRTPLRQHIEFLADCLARSEARAWAPARRRALATLLFGIASGSSSVQSAVYPDSADLAALAEALAGPIARALVEIARSVRTSAARARRTRGAR
jgi:AcrR family transcriptional regulator